MEIYVKEIVRTKDFFFNWCKKFFASINVECFTKHKQPNHCVTIGVQGLVTIHVNILSMHKHKQGWTLFFTPARFKSCLFFKFLLIYSKPCLVQLPRPYSFQKNIMTSPRLPLVKMQRPFLSGICLSTQLHGPKVKVTAPPIKNRSSELSGF